jgi:AcrR family transcriptional regulator
LATETERTTSTRVPLSPERVFEVGVAYADEHGIDELSMRKLGQELGVEAMSLYHHVKNKDEILDGMLDVVVSEIELTSSGDDWKSRMRSQIMAARVVMKRHPWAPKVIESRGVMPPRMMKYFDALGGEFLDGGFSVDLMHHAMHVLGSRVLGFTQELFDDSAALEASPEVQAVMMQQMVAEYPNISKLVAEIQHQEETVVGSGCDDDIEFRFSLDLMLDGLERVRDGGHEPLRHEPAI